MDEVVFWKIYKSGRGLPYQLQEHYKRSKPVALFVRGIARGNSWDGKQPFLDEVIENGKKEYFTICTRYRQSKN